MPIFELTPIDLDDPDWKASTHHAPCVVRADNEDNARLAATLAFIIATRRELGKPTPINPWNQENKVEAHLVTEHGFRDDGPQMVLAPAGGHPSLEDKDGKPVS
jgi:hypothetical protein